MYCTDVKFMYCTVLNFLNLLYCSAVNFVLPLCNAQWLTLCTAQWLTFYTICTFCTCSTVSVVVAVVEAERVHDATGGHGPARGRLLRQIMIDNIYSIIQPIPKGDVASKTMCISCTDPSCQYRLIRAVHWIKCD